MVPGASGAAVGMESATRMLTEKVLVAWYPKLSVTVTFNVTVTDSFGYQATRTFSVSILVALSIPTAAPLAPGTIRVGYFQTISAIGGAPPYTFSVPSGSLP